MKKTLLTLMVMILTGAVSVYAQQEEHGDEHNGHDDHAGKGEKAADAELNADQRRMAGIETRVVKRQPIGET
ncbi:MAG: hypothetical protein FD130_2443, partial [Halothiobacillaceae bacterium]